MITVFGEGRGFRVVWLARTPYLAGDRFTAADISVTYALEFAQRTGAATLGAAEQAYLARTTARPAYQRAMNACQATRRARIGSASSSRRHLSNVATTIRSDRRFSAPADHAPPRASAP